MKIKEILSKAFKGNISSIEKILEKNVQNSLNNFRANLHDVSSTCKDDNQHMILVNSYTVSLMVNMAVFKLASEIQMAKENGLSIQDMTNICRINANVFESVGKEISKKINEVLKNEIGENVTMI